MTAPILDPSTNSGSMGESSVLDQFRKNADSKKLASWVNDEYKKAKNARSRMVRQWYMNLSFYYGNQYVDFVKTAAVGVGGKLITPQAPPHRVRMTVNRIRPAVRTELARLTSQKPNASVVPASSEDEDLFAAVAGEQVWQSLHSRKKIHTHFSRMAWWMCVTGTGFMKVWWDDLAFDKDSQEQGDICFGNVTPFHLFVPDLREQEIEDQPFVLNAYTKPVEWVQRFYSPEVVGELRPSVVSTQEILDDAYLNLKGAGETQPDSVLILEAWLKPGATNILPDGGFAAIINDRVVAFSEEGIPYTHNEYPFTKFEHIPSGKFYADSVIPDLVPLQREYNRTRSQIIEAKNRMAKPQLLAPRGSIDPSKITTEPGQVILYRPGFAPPQPLPLQPLPAYVMEELNRSLLDIEDISGQHQVSKGSTPPGVTAATAISYLQEKDDSLLTHSYQSIEAGMEKIAKQALTLAVQYWDLPRTIKTVGSDGAFDTQVLKGSQIASGTDIRMEGGSSLPTSKAAKQAFIMDMMKMGFIPPQEGLKIMEIGGVQKIYDQLQIDERQAQRENLRLKRITEQELEQYEMQFQQAQMQGDPETMDVDQGMPLELPLVVPVNTWDNHAVHIEIHNRFRKTQMFELLAPRVQAEFEKHVRLHAESLIQAGMGAQMNPVMGEEMGGAPGPEPGGGNNQFGGLPPAEGQQNGGLR